MDELTFEDVITHYQLKLRENSDGLESLKNLLKKAISHIENGWNSPAADICREKLEHTSTELSKSLSEISDALIKLSAISELLSQEDITTF